MYIALFSLFVVLFIFFFISFCVSSRSSHKGFCSSGGSVARLILREQEKNNNLQHYNPIRLCCIFRHDRHRTRKLTRDRRVREIGRREHAGGRGWSGLVGGDRGGGGESFGNRDVLSRDATSAFHKGVEA